MSEEKIIQLVKQHKLHLKALNCVQQLQLPDCYIAAGFVRNLVWDHLHQKTAITPLNDIDVIYFDAHEVNETSYLDYEQQLNHQLADVNWQVRNQAKMHQRNGDNPYLSSLDAMSYWPEKETAVAIRQTANNHYQCISAFGFQSLFNLQLSYNPKRERDIFEHRIKSKNWLVQWPKLTIKE